MKTRLRYFAHLYDDQMELFFNRVFMMEQSIIENIENLECSDRYILPNEWSFIKELLEEAKLWNFSKAILYLELGIKAFPQFICSEKWKFIEFEGSLLEYSRWKFDRNFNLYFILKYL